MIFKKTKIKGLYVIEPELRVDQRGFFARIFCKDELSELGIDFNIVQINVSFNKKKGTLRGMHFQKDPKAEGKIVQCLKGAVYDVVVDLRKDSKTYGQWVAEELTQDNKKILLVPKGFAQGFQTLADDCELQYFMSEFYSPEYQSGVRFDDPFFNITWPIKSPTISKQDKNWPFIEPVSKLR